MVADAAIRAPHVPLCAALTTAGFVVLGAVRCVRSPTMALCAQRRLALVSSSS